jgi:hypothetical protein
MGILPDTRIRDMAAKRGMVEPGGPAQPLSE